MTQDEIIRMALEAGMDIDDEASGFGAIITAEPIDIERFVDLVAEPWIETNKALAKEIIELKKQADQEPVGYFAYDEEHDIWEELTGPNAPGATKLYAAPVRTKDLTGQDLCDLEVAVGWDGDSYDFEIIINAVVSKLKEKMNGAA